MKMNNVKSISIMEINHNSLTSYQVIIDFDNNTSISIPVNDYNIDKIADNFQFPYNELIRYKFLYYAHK
jgi:hypothetical protein